MIWCLRPPLPHRWGQLKYLYTASVQRLIVEDVTRHLLTLSRYGMSSTLVIIHLAPDANGFSDGVLSQPS